MAMIRHLFRANLRTADRSAYGSRLRPGVTASRYALASALLAAGGLLAARLFSVPHAEAVEARHGRFTRSEAVARAQYLAGKFGAAGDSLSWSASPPDGRALWRVEGEEAGGRGGVQLVFDAAGDLRQFSRSRGDASAPAPGVARLSPEQTLLLAGRWRNVYERAHADHPGAAFDARTARVTAFTRGDARAVHYAAGGRNLSLTLDAATGDLLRLSAWTDDPTRSGSGR